MKALVGTIIAPLSELSNQTTSVVSLSHRYTDFNSNDGKMSPVVTG